MTTHWQKIDHSGSGPWCDDGTCRVCWLNTHDERYREQWKQKPPIAKPPEPPSRWAKIGNFALALWKHVCHGLPQASPEDVAKRWTICGPCEWNRNGECIQCGCPTNPKRKLANKLKWAEQSCPLLGNRPGPWWGAVDGEKIHSLVWRNAKKLIGKISKIVVARIARRRIHADTRNEERAAPDRQDGALPE